MFFCKTNGGSLDLNQSPKQKWPPIVTESWPTRNIKGGTSENEGFFDDVLDLHLQMQSLLN